MVSICREDNTASTAAMVADAPHVAGTAATDTTTQLPIADADPHAMFTGRFCDNRYSSYLSSAIHRCFKMIFRFSRPQQQHNIAFVKKKKYSNAV